jgi:hypothetical protein
MWKEGMQVTVLTFLIQGETRRMLQGLPPDILWDVAHTAERWSFEPPDVRSERDKTRDAAVGRYEMDEHLVRNVTPKFARVAVEAFDVLSTQSN